MYDVFGIAEKPKECPALISDRGLTVTYGELAKQAAALGQAIGDRSLVFCMCKNEPGAVAGYLGALAGGSVSLLLAENLRDEAFAALFAAYRPAYIWASEEWMKQHGALDADFVQKSRRGDLAQENVNDKNICGGMSRDRSDEANPLSGENRVFCGIDFRHPIYEIYGYGLYATGQETYPMHSELALLLATSGSTGSPKLVRLSRKNLSANAASICEYLRLDASERPITTLPMQYTYGLSVLNSHLLAGAAVLMTTAGYVQSAFWDFFEKQRATSFAGVPYTYEILKKIHLFSKRLLSLRTITQAGGRLSVPLQKEVAEWAKAQNVRFYVMYGQTEATARMSYLPSEKCLEKLGSIGIAIPGGQFTLMKETGELVYTGENVSLGYASCADDLQLGDERHGVLYTGDLARCDEDGFYYIVGRKKRFVKIFGVRVSLDACEQTLREWYPEAELVCAGADDCLNIYVECAGGAREEKSGENENAVSAGSGETGADFSECSDENDSQPEKNNDNSMAERLADYLHLNRRAFHVIFIDRIPKNEAGKILYRELPGEK